MLNKPPPTLPIGKGLGHGRYKVIKKLGTGGYGAVYLAQDSHLSRRQVAIKELLDPSPKAKENFEHEAQLLAQLKHPGLVSVSDFFPEGRSVYLVMDYIQGRDLLDLAIKADKAKKLLPADMVAQWIVQVCEAVAYLHSRKPAIVHRDIKPNNIRINTQDQAILVDFGIAKVDPKAKTRMIAKAVSSGFSPPEQYAGGGGTDTRSDVYALGATMYCMLTVRPPPDGFERLVKDAPLIPPKQINSQVSSELDAVVMKAMALNSVHRYQDADEMLADLQRALGIQPSRSYSAPKPGSRPAISPSPVSCPTCGTFCRPGARFCSHCRTALGGTNRQQCPTCGTLCRPNARFCPTCRTTLSSSRQTPAAPAQARQHLTHGERFASNSQFQQAISEFEKAVSLGLETAPLFTGLGRCYIEMDRLDEAIDLLERGVRKYPKDAIIHAQLAIAYMNAKKFSQAIQTLELAYQLDPDNDDLGQLLADQLFDMGKHEKARPIFERLVRSRANVPMLQYRLAMCYLMTNRFDEAERLAQNLQRTLPGEAELSMLLGMIQLRKGNGNRALKYLNQAIQQNPKHALAHYFIGEIYYERQQWANAVNAYHNCAHANPRDADPHAKLCMCYMAMGRPTEAVNALEQALNIDPGNSMALNIVAQMVGDGT